MRFLTSLAMGSMTDLFGASPRVTILEAFAESPDEEFSVPELVAQTGSSRRGVYMHVRQLVEDGVLRASARRGKCQFYRLNEEDKRGRLVPLLDSVITIGRLEREIKRDPKDAPRPAEVSLRTRAARPR